jgi:hypothetical protein
VKKNWKINFLVCLFYCELVLAVSFRAKLEFEIYRAKLFKQKVYHAKLLAKEYKKYFLRKKISGGTQSKKKRKKIPSGRYTTPKGTLKFSEVKRFFIL